MLLARRTKLIQYGSEDEIQARFIRWVDENMDKHPPLRLIYAVPNGGKRTKMVAARMKLTGARAGVPDIHVAVPNSEYPGLWIEFKKPKSGRATPAQLQWQARLIKAGYKVVTHTSWVKAANEVIRYLMLPITAIPRDPTEDADE